MTVPNTVIMLVFIATNAAYTNALYITQEGNTMEIIIIGALALLALSLVKIVSIIWEGLE
jgi:hypothetical protein